MKQKLSVVFLLFMATASLAGQQYYTGDGGRGVRLAVGVPAGKNLPAAESWLPRYVQNMFTGAFNKFSAMTIIARQDLERVLEEQKLSLSGAVSDDDYIRIGNLTNAGYILSGSLEPAAGGRYTGQWTVTETATGKVAASFAKISSFAELRNASAINEAAGSLLEQMGVRLTAAAKRELAAPSLTTANAQAAQAKGLLAQQNGNTAEALSYFYLAASYDPSAAGNAELRSLSSQITGNDIGSRIRNAIAQRNAWLKMLKDCAAFYRDHLPFDIVYEPVLTQVGTTNYGAGTADFTFNYVEVRPQQVAFKVINDILSGLEATGNRVIWDFSGWPLINGRKYPEPEAVMFGGNRTFQFTVAVELVDAAGKSIGKDTLTLKSSVLGFNAGDRQLSLPAVETSRPRFTGVKIMDYTPPLSARIVSVNGISAKSLNENGFMRVLTAGEYNRLPENAARR
jgi:hypothetical protein